MDNVRVNVYSLDEETEYCQRMIWDVRLSGTNVSTVPLIPLQPVLTISLELKASGD